MKSILIVVMALMLGACSATTGQNVIKSANTVRAIQGLTTAGISESATNCIKDIFDPANRGSRC
jgi:uncharacterized protein YcfL